MEGYYCSVVETTAEVRQKKLLKVARVKVVLFFSLTETTKKKKWISDDCYNLPYAWIKQTMHAEEYS